MERLQLLKLRSLCAALCVATLSTASAASADGPLANGEILVANFDGFIHRVQPEAPHTVETITTKGDLSVAIANKNTIYTLDSEGASGTLFLYKVDVTTGQDTLLAQFPGYLGDIAVEPSGAVLVCAAEDIGSGRIHRVDPMQDPPTSEVLVQGAFGTHYANWGAAIEATANGDIFARDMMGRVWRLENGSLVEVWQYELFGLPFDVDHATGELIVHDGFRLKRAAPTTPFSPTSVFGGLGYVSGLDEFTYRIALDANGRVLFSDRQDNVYRADPADPTAPPVNIYPHEDVVRDIEVVLPACANGLDDNGNGPADFPAEAGCTSPADPFEFECSVSFGSSRSPNGAAGVLLMLGALLWRRKKSA